MADITHSLKEHTYTKPAGLTKLGLGVLKSILRRSANKKYNARIEGAELLEGRQGRKTILVANHVSFDDAFMLGLNVKDDMAYAIDTSTYNNNVQVEPLTLANLFSSAWRAQKLKQTILRYVQLVPIDPMNPMSMRKLIKIVNEGTPLTIFPEGALTKTGTLGKIYDGTATIAAATGADVFSANLRGFEFLESTSRHLEGFPRYKASDLAITFFPPTKIEPAPEGLSRQEKKAFINQQMKTLMHSLRVRGRDRSLTLSAAFKQAVWNFGPERNILESYKLVDGVAYMQTATYGDVLLKSLVLGGHIKRYTSPREHVGFMLPNSEAATEVLMGLHMAGCVPAMLNPTHSSQQLVACAKTAAVETIVTSRQFVQKARLETRMEELAKTCRIIYLEDDKDKISLWSKLKGKAQASVWKRPDEERAGLAGTITRGLGKFLEAASVKIKPDDPAVILFSTGSEGDPKAIVHSSQTLLANTEQVRSYAALTPKDILFNPMPVFHSFGLTGGLIMPLMNGVKSIQYPSPLDNKAIPDAVYHQTATIILGTATFLGNYSRYADPKSFANLKHAISGGERLDPARAVEFQQKYGVEIDSCYGATETAPVISMNTRGERKQGTVGKILPEIAYRLEPVEGIEEGGRLFVKGPNIMLGIMKSEQPGIIQPPEQGWHDTGDIVSIDPEGYITIQGRARNFAKIGGEMVSLDLIEKFANAASMASPAYNRNKPSQNFALAVKDEKRGERIIILTTDKNLTSEQVMQAAKDARHDSGLGVPKAGDIVAVPAMPKIGIKINGPLLKKIFAGTAQDKDLIDGGLNPQEWDGIGAFKPGPALPV